LQFNSDTGNNYDYNILSDAAAASAPSMWIGKDAGSIGVSTLVRASGWVELTNVDGEWTMAVWAMSGTDTGTSPCFGSGFWRSTARLTSLDFTTQDVANATIGVGSKFWVEGRV